MLQPMSVETMTFRNHTGQDAAPVRYWSAFQFGWDVGGAGTHWAGMSWRFSPWDFQVATRTRERYGAKKLEGLQLQDWGVTYEDMEPYYDRFEHIAGTSGKAGNLRGQRIAGGNVFEGPRNREYPTPPLKDTYWMNHFRTVTEKMGFNPFTVPAGNLSQSYTNALGVTMGPCTYCGFCDFHGCGNYSKSSPQACILPVLMRRPNFTLLTETEVLHAVKHADGKTVTGVNYITADGELGFQPADVVCITAYQMDNVRLMLLSGVGKPYDPDTGEGTVGRNYNYQTCTNVTGFFDGARMNPFIGAGALAVQIDDYNGDNFDHSKLDFIGGAGIMATSTNGRPIQNMDTLRPGSKRWGSAWKESYARDYQTAATIFCQGTSMPNRATSLSLDPTYRDRHGQPLLRLTFDWNQNDINMNNFIADKAVDIMREAGGKDLVIDRQTDKAWNPYRQVSSHTIGGAVMGADPTTSALNPFLQSWDCHNMFVVGASAFPNNGGYNPTITVGALAVRAAKAIHESYIGRPGPLVRG